MDGVVSLRQNLLRVVLLDRSMRASILSWVSFGGDVLHPAHLLWSRRSPPGGLLRLGQRSVFPTRVRAP